MSNDRLTIKSMKLYNNVERIFNELRERGKSTSDTLLAEDLAKFGVKKHPRWKIDINNDWWNREVTDGEVGCALSHVDTWVDAYARDMEITMILEEDFKQDIEVRHLFKFKFNFYYLAF